MIGRRVETFQIDAWSDLQPGDYGVCSDGRWWVCDPNGGCGPLGGGHAVEEHDDGTITVHPSIVSPQYHGWLRHGVWEAA